MEMKDSLIKAILKYIEKNGELGKILEIPEFPNYSEDEILYHLDLCDQAGFITGQRRMIGFFPRVLTYQGQMELRRLRSS